MTTKCYIIEWSTENETLFEDLIAARFNFSVHILNSSHFEIYIDTEPSRLRDLEAVMEWYV